MAQIPAQSKAALERLYAISRVPLTITDSSARILDFMPLTEHHFLPENIVAFYIDYYLKHRLNRELPMLLSRPGDTLIGIVMIADDLFVIAGPVTPKQYKLEELMESFSNSLSRDEIIQIHRVHMQSPPTDPMRFANILSEISYIAYGTNVPPGEIISRWTKLNVTVNSGRSSVQNDFSQSEYDGYTNFLLRLESAIAHGNITELNKLLKNPHLSTRMMNSTNEKARMVGLYTLLTIAVHSAMVAGVPLSMLYRMYILNLDRLSSLSDTSSMLGIVMSVSLECCEMVRSHDFPDNLPDALLECERYINEHISEKILVDDLAKACGLSRRRLYVLFESNYHCTINDFIQRERLRRAIVLISSANYTMSEISSSLGFTSQSHFITVFKKHYAVTPSEYASGKYFEALYN